jgi:hypothetical protein
VSSETNVDALALGQETRNVLAAEAVADSANLLRALLLHVCQSLLDDRVDSVRQVALALGAALGQPLHDVKVSSAELVELDGVALKKIGHDDPVAVGGELVGDQLGVDEGVAHDIGKDDDGVCGVLVLGVADVGGDWGGMLVTGWLECRFRRKRTVFDGGELALGFTFVPDTDGAAFTGRVGGHCGGLWGFVVGVQWYGVVWRM